jgi:hypothetical protein
MNSYRLPEALAADAIPVVTSEFLPPFHPEIDWSNCMVRVSEVRVVDIPSILRSIPEDEIHRRRQECNKLHMMVFGEGIDQHFTVAMKIWAVRVKNAMQKHSQIQDAVFT